MSKAQNSMKIMVGEDDEVLLATLTKKLKNAGYIVASERSGETVIQRIAEEHPNLILLDILLPKRDGFEILADLKKDTRFSSIPVIIISNSGQPVDIDKALALGAKDYLVKVEFTPEEVVEKIEKILGPRPNSQKDLEAREGPSILVVEDDKFLRSIIVQKLSNEGFQVEEAIDGDEAWKKIKKDRPMLILLDLLLPGIDGFEILRRIKEDSELAKIPVLVLSNMGQEEDIKKAKELGAKDFMVKAYFVPTEIVAKIREILREVYF